MMKKLYLILPLLLITACIGVSQSAKFYSLQTLKSGEFINNKAKFSVGIDEISLAEYLDKPQIVTVKSNMIELDVSEFNRWSESLSTMIQRVMAEDLGYYLPNAVIKPQISLREDFKYTIQIELNKFDGQWNEKASLEAWWSIADSSGNVIKQQKTTLSAPLTTGYDNLVKVQSQLLSELAEIIAKSLATKS